MYKGFFGLLIIKENRVNVHTNDKELFVTEMYRSYIYYNNLLGKYLIKLFKHFYAIN